MRPPKKAKPQAATLPLLAVENLSKAFGGVQANKNISLSVPQGGIVGLIGPNGSGKTTLFNAIVGAFPLAAGSVRFDGREISTLTTAQIARLGLLRTFQQTKVYTKMTCLENLVISAPVKQALSIKHFFQKASFEEQEKMEELLHLVGLADQRHLLAGSLSFGQQKLLEFAMALMSEPRMLLFDEPTAGINPTLINSIVELLLKINQRFSITLLIIEHNMKVIMQLASRLYCLAYGEVLAEGTPKEITNNPQVVAAYLGARRGARVKKK